MKIINFFVLVTLLIVLSVYAVNAKERDTDYRKDFHAAEYYFINDDYEKALPIYQKVYTKNPHNNNVAMFLGMCYLSIPNKAAKAIEFLENAANNYALKTKEQSHKELKANIYSIYFLGYAYQLNYRFDEALEAYNKFLKINEDEDDYYSELARSGVYSCLKAKALLQYIKPCWFENLGQKINTKRDESFPCINKSENLLIYTKNTEKKATAADYRMYDLEEQNATITEYRILISHRKDNRWSKPKDITNQLRTNGKCHTLSVSADGKRLYLYKDNYAHGSIEDLDNGTIYVSHYVRGKWTPIEKLNKHINTMAWETFAIESEDGQTLYFVSDKIDGIGGTDIYISKKTEYNTWGKAILFPAPINTEFDESSIFPVGDTTIYFSSMGHLGIGNLDLFVSHRIDSVTWSEPKNLGFPINSPIDDIMFMPTANGRDAYTHFMRTDGIITVGGSDIYKIELDSDEIIADTDIDSIGDTKLSGQVHLGYDNDSTPELKIYFYDPENNGKATIVNVDNITRSYSTVLKAGIYQLTLEKNDTTLYSQRLELNGEPEMIVDIPSIVSSTQEPEQEGFLSDTKTYPYSVQLSAKYNQVLIEEYFPNVDSVEEHYCNDKLYRYITGRYKTIEEADSALAYYKNLGYSDAFIGSSERIASLLEDKVIEGQLFTIQVFSSHFQVSQRMLTGLTDVREVKMSLKRYIYISGKFSNFEKAQTERNRIKSIGFPDAFVTNIDRYPNTRLVK